MSETNSNWTVLTGSTGGIGSEIAKILAARGNGMILVNRSETKAQAQRAALLASHPDLAIHLVTADLMDTKQVLKAIDAIAAIPGCVDVLYNNSGLLTSTKKLSPQGYESQFAVNVLAAYQLTTGLRAKMARTVDKTPAMVVNLSSSAITPLKMLDLDNLANPETVGGLMSTYAQTKLAVTMLAPALADDLKSDNILIRAIDPGATKSAMTTGGNDAMPKLLAWLAPLLFKAADKQALKLVDSAQPNAFDGATGLYVANRKPKKLPAPAQDVITQRNLIDLLNDMLRSV